jgi:hypothetical protein
MFFPDAEKKISGARVGVGEGVEVDDGLGGVGVRKVVGTGETYRAATGMRTGCCGGLSAAAIRRCPSGNTLISRIPSGNGAAIAQRICSFGKSAGRIRS